VVTELLKKTLIRFAGTNLAHRIFMRDDVTVFLFHDVSSQPSQFSNEYKLNVSPETFSTHLRWISEKYHLISPIQLKAGRYQSPAALITFDDGFPGYFENAVPILEEFGFPSVIFLNMSPILGGTFWSGLVTYLCDKTPNFRQFLADHLGTVSSTQAYLQCTPSIVEDFLETEDREFHLSAAREFYGKFAERKHLESMAQHVGSVYFGNHLFNHYNAVNLTFDELQKAFTSNQKKLKEFPNFVDFFSYPFGQPGTCYNDATDCEINRLGPSFIFNAYPLPNRSRGSKFLNRISMNEGLISKNHFYFQSLIVPRLNERFRKNRNEVHSS